MGKEVEHPCREAARSQGQHHVAELAHRRVGEHAFDVVAGQTHAGGEDRGKAADDGDYGECLRDGFEEWIRPCDEIDARGDHRRCVDQRRNWRRTFHGVWQPDMQRELAALADRAREQAQARPEQDGLPEQAGIEQGSGVVFDLVEELRELERAAAVPEDDQADQEADVTDACGDERFFGGDPRRQQVDATAGGAIEPEADQQIAAQADELPADEEEQHIVRQNDGQHAEREQRQVREEARVTRVEVPVLDHVRARVHVDQEADHRNDHEHDRRERIDLDTEAQELFGSRVGCIVWEQAEPVDLGVVRGAGQRLGQDDQEGQEHRDAHRHDRHPGGQWLLAPRNEDDDQEGDERQQEDGQRCCHHASVVGYPFMRSS